MKFCRMCLKFYHDGKLTCDFPPPYPWGLNRRERGAIFETGGLFDHLRYETMVTVSNFVC